MDRHQQNPFKWPRERERVPFQQLSISTPSSTSSAGSSNIVISGQHQMQFNRTFGSLGEGHNNSHQGSSSHFFVPQVTSTPNLNFRSIASSSSAILDESQVPPLEDFNFYFKWMREQPGSQEMLRDELSILQQKGVKERQDVHPLRGSSFTKTIVSALMNFSKKLKVNDAVKFKAIELYDRFMIKKNEDLRRKMAKGEGMKKLKKKHLPEAYMYMIMCIQISSKINNKLFVERVIWHRKSLGKMTERETNSILHNSELLETMRVYSPGCSMKTLLDIEMKLAAKLWWDLNPLTPMDYIPSLICVLDLPRELIRKVYANAALLCDVLYQEHGQIYKILFQKSGLSRDVFRQKEFDVLLRAGGILDATLFIVFPVNFKGFRQTIENLLGIPVREFADFSAILLKFVTP